MSPDPRPHPGAEQAKVTQLPLPDASPLDRAVLRQSIMVAHIDFRAQIRTVMRRKGLVAAITLSAIIIAALVVFQITPQYTAETRVLIDARKTQVLGQNIEQVLSALSVDDPQMNSQVQVLRSRSLAARVIERARLEQYAEFNPELRSPPSLLRRWLRDPLSILPDSIRAGTGFEKATPVQLSVEEQAALRRTTAIDIFLDRVRVELVQRSQVIAIRFPSPDPRLAAAITNAIAAAYLDDQMEAKYEATQRATTWIGSRLDELRDAVRKSEVAVEEYRRQAGITGTRTVTVTDQQLSELNSQYILARTRRAEAEARLGQIQSLTQQGGAASDVGSATEVLQSPLIINLVTQEAAVQRRLAELNNRYGDRHPRILQANAEMEDLRKKIVTEVDRVARSVQNELQVARAREAELSRNLDRLQRANQTQGQAEVRLRELQREADANRALFEAFLNRFKETSEQREIQQPDARIISRAEVPTEPSFPNKRLVLILAAVVGLLIAILVVYLLERLDKGFRAATQMENATGIPVISLIPSAARRLRGNEPLPMRIISEPISPFAEAVRSVWTTIRIHEEPPLRSLLVTSSLPAEGKTTIAMAVATMAGAAGLKAILLECDLRRPSIAKALGLQVNRGIVELLTTDATVSQVTARLDNLPLDLILAEKSTANSANLLSSQKLVRLIRTLEQSYDLVVIDSPPTLAVSDTKILSRIARATLFVVRWEETRREDAMQGLKLLTDIGAPILGTVLSRVDLRRHSRYGYADMGSYYRKYSAYYHS